MVALAHLYLKGQTNILGYVALIQPLFHSVLLLSTLTTCKYVLSLQAV